MSKRIGLIVVGDEILSGRRQDKHLSKVIELLGKRGMQLSWAKFVPDDLDALVKTYQDSLASGDIIFSSGGIGATPDDKTRQAMAQALNLPLVLHPQAAALIEEHSQELAKKMGETCDMSTPENQHRLQMGMFPQGAEIVPNPYNKIPGFYIQQHTFVPGFPEMAWAMIEWTLDTRYKALHGQLPQQLGVIVYGMPESRLTPILEAIEKRWPDIATFSLPTVAKEGKPGFIDVGVKGKAPHVEEAFTFLKEAFRERHADFRDY